MARYVNVAALRFDREDCYQKPDAHARVLDDTRRSLAQVAGLGIDLVVTSEGVACVGMEHDPETLDRPGPYLSLYREFARAEKCVVVGSAMVEEKGRVYNAAVFAGPDGEFLGRYYKWCPTLAELDIGTSPGAGPVVTETPAGRLGTAICFDLNYDELLDGYRPLRPDILVFPSLYHGAARQGEWARALRTHFVAATQVMGPAILDPVGQTLSVIHYNQPVARARLNLDCLVIHLSGNMQKFPEVERKYRGEVAFDVPADLGTAILYSTSPKRTARDVAAEFKLEPLDDYLPRALAAARAKA